MATVKFLTKKGEVYETDVGTLVEDNPLYGRLTIKTEDLEKEIKGNFEIDRKAEKAYLFVRVKSTDSGFEYQSTKNMDFKDYLEAGAIFGSLISAFKSQNSLLEKVSDGMAKFIALPCINPEIPTSRLIGTRKALLLEMPMSLLDPGGVAILQKLHALDRFVTWHAMTTIDRALKLVASKTAAEGVTKESNPKRYQEIASPVLFHFVEADQKMYKNPKPFPGTTLVPDSWIIAMQNFCSVRRYLIQFLAFCQSCAFAKREIEVSKFKFEPKDWNPTLTA